MQMDVRNGLARYLSHVDADAVTRRSMFAVQVMFRLIMPLLSLSAD
jgi:hypothetical protein